MIEYKSPSNLALVKYWGKYGRQMPCNTSISFTLSEAYTEMRLAYSEKQTKSDEIALSFEFEGKENEAFRAKLLRFLGSVSDELPFVKAYQLSISSSNSFPHSAGIASSASSMSALALCLCEMERQLGASPTGIDFRQRASRFARLFSGSACRSVFPHLALWGKHPKVEGSSDDYAIGMSDAVHPMFHQFRDSILLVSREEKSVSSTAGHELMNQHPFAQVRYAQAQQNIERLLAAMRGGDLEVFGEIVEEEALTLHGLMMNSRPSYILMQPNTLALIQQLRQWRRETQLPVYFSLDAGPNLHLLYPAELHDKVAQQIREQWSGLCDGGAWIEDRVG